MPELPEVEAVVRTLRPIVRGKKIRCVHIFHAIAAKPQKPAFLAKSAGQQKIRAVSRLGKYIVLGLTRGIVALHFRLDGQLLWFSSAKELFARANCAPENVHVDV